MTKQDVAKVVLDNGMTVLVKETRSAPVVAINTWVNVGYFDEPDSLTGISHLLEHMFFKGTKKRKVGELRDQTRNLGGYLNGGTIYEYTHYYTVIPRGFAEEGLEIQSDALLNSVIDSLELEKEKKVVIQEVKRKLDRPNALAWEKLMELSFEKYPIRRWRMGTEEQNANFSKKDLENHYLSFYRPDNIILSIVGDIQTEEILEMVEKYYGHFRREETEKRPLPTEPDQKEFRYLQMKGDITQSYLKIGFHIPATLDQDFFALDVLSHILGHGRSSRLGQVLKEREKLVSSVESEAFGLKDMGVFIIEAELEARDLPDAEAAIFGEIERLQTKNVSDFELTKAKNVIKFSHLSSIETAMGYAENLAFFESHGDYRLAEKYLENVEKVTKEDIRRVASAYLTLEGASLLEYRPNRDFQKKITGTMIKDAINESLAKAVEEKEGEELTFAKSGEKRAKVSTAKTEANREELFCGAALITKENHFLPLASLSIYFKGGQVCEGEDNCGITQLALRTGLKGTKSRSAYEISNLMEMLGGSIELETTADYLGYTIKVLSENLNDGLGIISDVIQNPIFEPQELEKERNVLLAEIQKAKDSMRDYPVDLFYQAIYPHHPYGLNSLGKPEALIGLRRKEVVDWYHRFAVANNMLVVAVGDFESERFKEELNKVFGDFKKGEIPTTQMVEAKKEDGESILAEERAKAQTAQALGFITCPYQHDDFYPLKVLQSVASGSGGRFFHELREKRSLAYTVYGHNDSWGEAGVFYAYIATFPEKEEAAKEGLLNEFSKFKTVLVDEDELETAKRYISGMYQIYLQTNSALAKQCAKAELLGRGTEEVEEYPEKISQVTREQVRDVAAKYFDEKRLGVGVVRGRK